jgi:beta-glucosidase
MEGRTYRYFKGTALYPFGYGLSYTRFTYSGMQLDTPTVSADGHLKVTMKVKNTGQRAGDEVVQLYVRAAHDGPWRSNKELRGFQRVNLQPGEEKSVSFDIEPRTALRYYDDTRHAYAVDPGRYEVQVGASSADIRLTAPFDVRD